jgi:hypothetical protein
MIERKEFEFDKAWVFERLSEEGGWCATGSRSEAGRSISVDV